VVEEEAAVLEGESESAEIKSFKVHGDVGIVHAHMVKPLVSLRTSTIDIPSGIYMYVCIYICVCVCLCIYIYIHIHIHIDMCIYII